MHTSQYADWGGHWALWGGGNRQLFEKASFNIQFTYDESNIFSTSANIAYILTARLILTPEISYKYHGNNREWNDDSRISFHNEDAFQGIIRLQRTF